MTLALICSGQGRLGRDMLSPFADHAETRPLFAAAEAQLGMDPFTFLANATDSELTANRNSQILCVTRSLAAATVLKVQDLPADTIVTGYSIGELAAWGVAGVWKSEHVIDLAARRAEAMDRAGGRDGLLGYVRGLSEAAVQGLCDGHRCHIAIRNPDRLFVVGGDKRDVLALCTDAATQGAMRAAAMNIHIASHTPRLESAVTPFQTALLGVEPERPRLRLMSTQRQSLVSSPARAIPDLAAQMAKPIDWATTLIALQERGVSRILELGPGSSLAEMANAADQDWEARSFDDFETASGASHWFLNL